MNTVYVDGGVVQEVVPDYALPVEQWYGDEYARKCVEAPDDVVEGWRYHEGIFLLPVKREEIRRHTVEEDTAALLVDQEYRITLLELGVNEHAV